MIHLALLGLAAGDVLGSAVEGRASGRFDVETLPGPHSTTTDDTQQALVLAAHLMEGRVRRAELARELASHSYRGSGPGFARFVGALADGAEPQEAAQPSAGNGAAMRSTPIALATWRAPETMVSEALAAATVTHADPRGAAAGVAVPAALHAAARGASGADLLHETAEDVTEAEHTLFGEFDIGVAPGDRWHTMSRALRAATSGSTEVASIAERAGRRAAETSATHNTSGTAPYAPASVVTAIAAAAFSTDPERTLRTLVGMGGDTDTVAAIAGAILAVRFTVEAWAWQVPNDSDLIAIGAALVAGEPVPVDLDRLLA